MFLTLIFLALVLGVSTFRFNPSRLLSLREKALRLLVTQERPPTEVMPEEGEEDNLRLLENALFNRAYEGFKDNKLIEELIEGIEHQVQITGKALLENEEQLLAGCWDVLYSNRLSEDTTSINKLTFNKIKSTTGKENIRVLSMMQYIDPVIGTYDNLVVFVPLEFTGLDSVMMEKSSEAENEVENSIHGGGTELPTNQKGLIWVRGRYTKYSQSYDPEYNPHPNRLNVTFESVSVHSIPKDVYGSYQCFAHLYMCEKYDLPCEKQKNTNNSVSHWDWSSLSWKEEASILDRVEREATQKQLAQAMDIEFDDMYQSLEGGGGLSAWSDVTYLDDTGLRVMRGQQKGVYVLLKCEE